MNELLNSNQHSVVALLAGLCILMTISIAKEAMKFLWDLNAKRNEVTGKKIQDLTEAVNNLTIVIQDFKVKLASFDQRVVDVDMSNSRMKLENKRIFFAIKELLGAKYADVMRRASEEEDFL